MPKKHKDLEKRAREKAASSSRANADFGANGFIGFSQFASNSSSLDTSYLEESLPSLEHSETLRVIFRRLNKKDNVTRLKALQELKVIVAEGKPPELRPFMGQWVSTYQKLVQENNWKVREMTNSVQLDLCKIMKKAVSTQVQKLFTSWWCSITDPTCLEASNYAKTAFDICFLSAPQGEFLKSDKTTTTQLSQSLNSQFQVLELCSEGFLNDLESALVSTPQTISALTSNDTCEMEERYTRIISSMCLALSNFIERVPKNEHIVNRKNLIVQFTTKFLTIKYSLIRRCCYQLLCTVVEYLPLVQEELVLKHSHSLYGLLGDKESSNHSSMWKAFFNVLKSSSSFNNSDIKKILLPKLWSLLRHGCYGSGNVTYPLLLNLLHSLHPLFSLEKPLNHVEKNTLEEQEQEKNEINQLWIQDEWLKNLWLGIKSSNNTMQEKKLVIQSFLDSILFFLEKGQITSTDLLEKHLFLVLNSFFLKQFNEELMREMIVKLFDFILLLSSKNSLPKRTTFLSSFWFKLNLLSMEHLEKSNIELMINLENVFVEVLSNMKRFKDCKLKDFIIPYLETVLNKCITSIDEQLEENTSSFSPLAICSYLVFIKAICNCSKDVWLDCPLISCPSDFFQTYFIRWLKKVPLDASNTLIPHLFQLLNSLTIDALCWETVIEFLIQDNMFDCINKRLFLVNSFIKDASREDSSEKITLLVRFLYENYDIKEITEDLNSFLYYSFKQPKTIKYKCLVDLETIRFLVSICLSWSNSTSDVQMEKDIFFLNQLIPLLIDDFLMDLQVVVFSRLLEFACCSLSSAKKQVKDLWTIKAVPALNKWTSKRQIEFESHVIDTINQFLINKESTMSPSDWASYCGEFLLLTPYRQSSFSKLSISSSDLWSSGENLERRLIFLTELTLWKENILVLSGYISFSVALLWEILYSDICCALNHFLVDAKHISHSYKWKDDIELVQSHLHLDYFYSFFFKLEEKKHLSINNMLEVIKSMDLNVKFLYEKPVKEDDLLRINDIASIRFLVLQLVASYTSYALHLTVEQYKELQNLILPSEVKQLLLEEFQYKSLISSEIRKKVFGSHVIKLIRLYRNCSNIQLNQEDDVSSITKYQDIEWIYWNRIPKSNKIEFTIINQLADIAESYSKISSQLNLMDITSYLLFANDFLDHLNIFFNQESKEYDDLFLQKCCSYVLSCFVHLSHLINNALDDYWDFSSGAKRFALVENYIEAEIFISKVISFFPFFLKFSKKQFCQYIEESIGFQSIYPLLVSSSYQIPAYTILFYCGDVLLRDQIQDNGELDQNIDEQETELSLALSLIPSSLVDLLDKVSGSSCPFSCNSCSSSSEGFPCSSFCSSCCLTLFLTWHSFLSLVEFSSPSRRAAFGAFVKHHCLLIPVLSCCLLYLPLEKVPNEFASLEFLTKSLPNLLNLEEYVADLASISAFTFYRTVKIFPAMARMWWTDECNRQTSSLIAKYTQEYISPLLFDEELSLITSTIAKNLWDNEEMVVKASPVSRVISTCYVKDDCKLEMNIHVPSVYPFRTVDVQCTKRIGVSDERWRRWVLQIIQVTSSQDGSILEAVLLWKRNVDKECEGVGPCPICYSTLHPKTYNLPNTQCKTCHNKYHNSCLYKWFKTSGKNKCPLCQQPFY